MEPLSSVAPAQDSMSFLMSTSELAGTTASNTELSTNSELPRGSASATSVVMTGPR